jgi:hypothetical protein
VHVSSIVPDAAKSESAVAAKPAVARNRHARGVLLVDRLCAFLYLHYTLSRAWLGKERLGYPGTSTNASRLQHNSNHSRVGTARMPHTCRRLHSMHDQTAGLLLVCRMHIM